MFNNGDLVVYGNNGVCKVEEITTLESDTEGRLYYVLKSKLSNGIAYVPVDSNVYISPVMSQSEAECLIEKIPSVRTDKFEGINSREAQRIFHDILLSHDNEQIIGLIKHIKESCAKKKLANKKLSATEERYLEQAKRIIDSELSVALGIDMDKLQSYIEARIKE